MESFIIPNLLFITLYTNKNTRNEEISMLLVANMDLWTLDNMYHPIYVRRKDFDSFIQEIYVKSNTINL